MMLSDNHQKILKDLAKKSIVYGLKYGLPLHVDVTTFSDELIVQRATFVTLEKQGKLRGCIGMLEACRPLAEDIAANSYAAAFSDPRFPPLIEDEINDLSIHISILNPAEIIPCSSEADLIEQLRPDIDGLILDDGVHRATFLPSVWESLPNPVDFIKHLKNKAGLPLDEWSTKIKSYRYTTESF
ncbi:MAG: AMMECR1 domain-containing protein [Gammaproteobacteria bacterium]|nr:MAG: AMMECR1 domain-containing protein [Gammaproteobacteria bacterium]